MIPLRDDNPSRHTPWVTYGLIVINVLVFLYEISLPEVEVRRFFFAYGMVPGEIQRPESFGWRTLPLQGYWTFFTCMFLHGGWLHLIGNMWTLYIFGDNIEDRMGPARYLLFYLLCGLAAGLVHWFTNQNSMIPTVGASGAIAGVMGAYLILYPRARILTILPLGPLITMIHVPAYLFLGFWFAVQLYMGIQTLHQSEAVAGIAWWAHAGGFAGGLGLRFVLVRRGSDRPVEWSRR